MKRLFLTIVLLAAFTFSIFSQALKVYYTDEKTPEILVNYASEHPISFRLDTDNELNIVFTTLDNGITERKISDIDRIEVPTDYFIASPAVINVPAYLTETNAYWGGISGTFIVASDYEENKEIKDEKDFFEVKEGYETNRITVRTLDIKDNFTGYPREGKITVNAGDKTATIKVVQSDKPLITEFETLSANNMVYVGPEETEIHATFCTDFGMWPKPDSQLVTTEYDKDGNIRMTVPENTGEERDIDINVEWSGLGKHMRQRLGIRQLHSGYHSKEEQLAALKDLYDTTDGENWTYKNNWWSENPVWKWDNVNNVQWDPQKIDRVYTLNFGCGQYNGMKGMIPESFTLLLDDLKELDLSTGSLHGKVPETITSHPRWGRLGWGILPQISYFGGGIDCEGINLRMQDQSVKFIDGTQTTAYEELKKHKIICISLAAPDNEELANLCLDYAEKGFYFITEDLSWDGGNVTLEQLCDKYDYVKQLVPNFNVSYNSFGTYDLQAIRSVGSHFLIDSEGNVIDYMNWDWDAETPATRVERIRPYLTKYLGEPCPHDPIVFPSIYESTDYSQDGQIMALQNATVGNGIDVIFMGDGYVDADVADPSVYEQTMKNAMECLFAVEPLKSLRNRFNVYMVKVVSKNRFEKDGEQALGYDYEKIASYVARTDADFSKSHICVIQNKANDFLVSGKTDMFVDGGSLAFIEQGQASEVIVHETGGHGIGKLLDEYVYSGYENNHTQPGAEEDFKNWIKDEYHSRGWGMNLSAESEADKVPWSRMLTDSWFKGETGIYKGAWFWPEELWRPSENSVMNTDYSRFNAPSREAIYKIVMSQSEGAEWSYDFEEFKAFDQNVMTRSTDLPDAKRIKKRIHQEQMPRTVEFRDGSHTPTFRSGRFQRQNNDNVKVRQTSGATAPTSRKKPAVHIRGKIHYIEDIEAQYPGLPMKETIKRICHNGSSVPVIQ